MYYKISLFHKGIISRRDDWSAQSFGFSKPTDPSSWTADIHTHLHHIHSIFYFYLFVNLIKKINNILFIFKNKFLSKTFDIIVKSRRQCYFGHIIVIILRKFTKSWTFLLWDLRLSSNTFIYVYFYQRKSILITVSFTLDFFKY